MAREVNFDIVAKDKASDTLDDVADKAEHLERLDPTVTVDADTRKADRDVDTFTAQLDRLTDSDKLVVLSLRAGNVKSELTDLMTEVATLDSSDPTIEVKAARIGDLTGELDGLMSKMREIDDTSIEPQVSEQAQAKVRQLNDDIDRMGTSQGPRLAGNQIADLTGPFGDASSAASNFGGVFDGLADIGESVAGKLGMDAEKMASNIAGVGLAVAGAAAVWTIFTQNQRKAREEQAKITEGQKKLNDAVAEGKLEESAQAFVDTYGKFYDAVSKAGFSYDDFVAEVTGSSTKIHDARQAWLDLTAQHGYYADAVNDAGLAVDKARESYLAANGTLAEQADQLGQTEAALRKAFPQLDKTADAADGLSDSADDASTSLDDVAGSAKDAADKLDTATAAMNHLRDSVSNDQAMLDLQDDFDAVGTSAVDAWNAVASGADDSAQKVRANKQDVDRLKQAIIDVGATAGATPVEVQATLDKIDQGDLAGAKADAENWFARNPVNINARLLIKNYPGQTNAGVGITPTAMPATTNNYFLAAPQTAREANTARRRYDRINGHA